MTSHPPQGLYDPRHEHDSCGVAFVVDVAGRRSHDVVARGRAALCRLDHRGARGAEPNTGDGAGVMIQIPDEFYRAVVDFELPPAGSYATGLVFLPTDAGAAARAVTGAGEVRRSSRAPRCSAGATCRSTRRASASPRWRPCRASGRSSWPRAGSRDRRRPGRRAAGRAGAGAGRCSACASRPSGRPASAAWSCTSRRCPAARSSTREC